jgi:hypothetical protein
MYKKCTLQMVRIKRRWEFSSIGRRHAEKCHPPASGYEAVKKWVRHRFPSFRRKPESRGAKDLQRHWTPVVTGVTAKIQFPHSFYPAAPCKPSGASDV